MTHLELIKDIDNLTGDGNRKQQIWTQEGGKHKTQGRRSDNFTVNEGMFILNVGCIGFKFYNINIQCIV